MRTVLAVALAAVATIAVPAAQSDMPSPVKFTAFAVDTSTMTTRARTSTVDVVINKWSPDADRDWSSNRGTSVEPISHGPARGYGAVLLRFAKAATDATSSPGSTGFARCI